MHRLLSILLTMMLIASMFSLLAVFGCEEEAVPEGTATPEATEPAPANAAPSQQELQIIMAEAMLSNEAMNSYRFDMDMDMDMEIIGGEEPGTVSMAMTGSGAQSQDPRQMQMIMNMSMDIPTEMAGDEAAEAMQDISMEMYLVDEWMYIKMDIPMMGEQWMKMAASEAMIEQYDMNLVDQQLEMLGSVVDIEFLRYETYDGSECYVVSVVPDMVDLLQWLGQQGMSETETDWESIDMLEDLLDEISYIMWIEKDTNLIKKLDLDMLMAMTAADMGEPEADFEKMIIDASVTMVLYDYDRPLTIILPEAAENAMDMSQLSGM